MARRQAPPRFADSAKVTNPSFAQRVTRLAKEINSRQLKIESGRSRRVEAVMNSSKFKEQARKALIVIRAMGLVAVLVGTMASEPISAAAANTKSGEENRIVRFHAVDRAEIENLQRWVAAGHEDWCKDARLVAVEEMKRIAVDFDGDATELITVDLGEDTDGGAGAEKAAFEWTPLDGGATYRVTVERFEWLRPIAKDGDTVVWVPTTTEIQIHE